MPQKEQKPRRRKTFEELTILFKIHKNGTKNYVLNFHKKVDFV